MPKLSFIDEQARRLAGRFPEPRRRALQEALIELCEVHWREIRGPEPATPLAHALWSVPPPLAELLVDLYAAGDARLAELPGGLRPARALALLVLAEIERGDAEGVHIAHEAMMVFESPAAGRVYAERIATALHGGLKEPGRHRRSPRTPLWRALAIITAHTARPDLRALVEVIRLLGAAPGGLDACPDEALERLRDALCGAGVRFLNINNDAVRYELHGREHKPASRSRLRDMLAEIRQVWLA
jgi:hypothetical protein